MHCIFFHKNLLDWDLQLSLQFQYPYFIHFQIYLRFWLILASCIVFVCMVFLNNCFFLVSLFLIMWGLWIGMRDLVFSVIFFNMIYFILEGRFKFGWWCYNVLVFSLFALEFVVEVFPELFILGIGGQISGLCNLPFMVLVLVEDLNFVHMFLAVVQVFVVGCFICVWQISAECNFFYCSWNFSQSFDFCWGFCIYRVDCCWWWWWLNFEVE